MKVIKSTGIKKLVDLNSIRKQVTETSRFTIKDAEFYNPDVQIALRMGWISAEDAGKDPTASEDEQLVRLRNTCGRELNILKRPFPVRADDEFTLTQKELLLPDIQVAIAKKMITPIEVADEDKKAEISEGTLTVSKIIQREESKAKMKQRGEQEEKAQVARRRGIDLDTNEEIAISNVISDPNPEPVTAPDSRKTKPVKWNPNKSESKPNVEEVPAVATKNASNVIDSENPDPVDSNEGDPKRKSVVVIQHSKEEIKFVDDEEERNRVKAHPKLKNKDLSQNEEVDLINPDEERRKKHPKLKDQKPSDEIDFISLA